MRSRARRIAGFTSGNLIVWTAGWKNIMQVEFHPPKTTGLGHCFVFGHLQQEMRRVGLKGNSNNHEDGDFVGWRNEATPSEGSKRRYEAHFISKLTDCDGENSETDSSLGFAKDCGYISAAQHEDLTSLCREIGKMLGSMISRPGPLLISDSRPPTSDL